MTLNQLEYFCAVCRFHSITRAANELFVSQPTISVAIRDLENEFHIRLFNHGKNQLFLTADGEEFYKKAAYILNRRNDLYSEFSARSQNKNPIKLGIPPMLSTVFFPDLSTAFQKTYPDIQLNLYEYGSVKACNLVQSEELNAAIVNLDLYNADKFNSNIFMEEQYVFCVSKAHRFASSKEITFDMLVNEPIILYNTDSVQNMTIKSRFNSYGIIPNVILYSSQIVTVKNFIRQNLGGAFLYSSILNDDPDIAVIPVIPAITSKVGLVWKKGIYIDINTMNFISFTKKYNNTAK